MKAIEDFAGPQKRWEVEKVEWREVELGDKNISKIIMGQSPPSSSYNKDKEGIPFLQGNKEFGKFHPTHVMFTTDPKKKAQKGDVLISVRAPVGDVNIADKEYCIGRGLAAIRFNGEPKYLFYLFVSIKKELEELGQRGTTFRAITKNHLKNLKIPIPFRNGKRDLETQKKIVEYIEANFSRIDDVLEKKKSELEQLDELWESVLEQAFKPKEGEEWREVRLEEIAHIESGNRPKGGVKKYTDGIPSIGGEHLSYDGTFSFEKLKYVPEDFYEQSNKGKIKKYDILIVKDGATTGKTAFVDDNFPFKKAMVNEHVFLCRISEERIYPKFVFRFLMSGEGQNRILKTKGGTAQGGINKRFSKLVKIPLPFRNNQPDLEKQREIANYLDGVYEKLETLKERIQNQINQLEEMKESVLDEVFNHDETK